jgi:hypothetical protein
MKMSKMKLAAAVLAGLAAIPAAKWFTQSPVLAQANDAAAANTLTDAEKAAGWKLLFDGKDLNGWHNFKKEGVKPGWQIKDGTLACVDPKNASDIVTKESYDSFELQLDYNISKGGNSGIMFHVTEAGGAPWASGPEVQLQDNLNAHDPELSGWLYQLYKPAIDPATQKPIDATKPFGEWNHIAVLITPEKCEVTMNGVKYYDFVLGSQDWKDRVAKSKFGKMKGFGEAPTGAIALQGDHGQVSFRNIKIRPIEKK